jgi:hypothetical protein
VLPPRPPIDPPLPPVLPALPPLPPEPALLPPLLPPIDPPVPVGCAGMSSPHPASDPTPRNANSEIEASRTRICMKPPKAFAEKPPKTEGFPG